MSGLPSAKPTGGQFDIILEATKDPIFYEWMTSNSLMNKVKIEISQSFTFGKTRKIELIDVYCLLHQDTFNGVNNQPMQTLIKLSPAILLQNGEKMFEWYWKVTDQDAEVEEKVLDTTEPKLLNYYIEDLENNRINDAFIKENQEIYLVINSENTQGEVVDIDLENHAIDFEYNGQWVKDDIINDVVLNDTFTKVKLKAVKQKEN